MRTYLNRSFSEQLVGGNNFKGFCQRSGRIACLSFSDVLPIAELTRKGWFYVIMNDSALEMLMESVVPTLMLVLHCPRPLQAVRGNTEVEEILKWRPH